jgi:hypothetical protein
MEDREKQFGGFAPPVSNYFRMPNEWINICAEITNLAELKVIQYVLRHTWGYQEYDGKPKLITIDEFMNGRKHKDGKSRMDKGTGLSEMSVRNGLEKAIEHGYILCDSDERDKARIKKSYTLNMLKSGVQDLDPAIPDKSEVQDLGTGVQSLDLGTQDLDLGTLKVRPRSEKDTKERHFKKEREKDSKPTIVEEISSLPVPNASLPLSPQKNEKKTDSFEEWYSLFDRLLQEKGYPSAFRVPRNEKNMTAIQELISMNATPEQVTFVLNHIWNDKDPFWRQHRGKITTIASQFASRVCEMTQSAPKRRTSSGFANWTEDKAMGAPTASDRTQTPQKAVAEAKVTFEPSQPVKDTTVPTQPALPVGYTRLKMEKPARARTLQGRMQAQQIGADYRKEL